MIPKGARVVIRAHKSEPGKGLSYGEFRAVLAEDCNGEGWDVTDLTCGRSVYAFSVRPLLAQSFDVTYDIVTPESAEAGDVDERGFIEKGARLRDALKALHATRTAHVDGVEAVECDSGALFSVTVINSTEFLTGAQETRTLHMSRSITRASRERIARLAGARV